MSRFFKTHKQNFNGKRKNERGVAMAMAIIIVAILSVVALTALAFSSTEVRIAASDLQRSQAFYASVSAMEKMTNDFSNLFRTKTRPTAADLD
ncbi:MAG: PilX N-terminal domain-containing pilus assembly protein, partial [Pyrinomonadaceae bacterium]